MVKIFDSDFTFLSNNSDLKKPGRKNDSGTKIEQMYSDKIERTQIKIVSLPDNQPMR